MSSREALPDLMIRHAAREDVAAIVRLYAEDFLGRERERPEEPLPPSYYAAFDEIDADPNNELIVVEIGGEVAGTLQITFIPNLTYQGGRRAQIEAVQVAEKYRNLGIGARLFAWAIQRARDRQCRLVQLTTNNVRIDAKRFYERLGFVASHTGMKLDLHKTGADSGR